MKIQLNISEIIKGADAEDKAPQRVYWLMMAQIMPVFLRELLKHVSGNKMQASRLAGLDRGTLDRRLKQYGVSVKKQVISEGVSDGK